MLIKDNVRSLSGSQRQNYTICNHLQHLHLRSVWWMILHVGIQYLYIKFVDLKLTAFDAPETHTYIEISLEHLIFQALVLKKS